MDRQSFVSNGMAAKQRIRRQAGPTNKAGSQ
jgi:hypothetical protein